MLASHDRPLGKQWVCAAIRDDTLTRTFVHVLGLTEAILANAKCDYARSLELVTAVSRLRQRLRLSEKSTFNTSVATLSTVRPNGTKHLCAASAAAR